MNGKKSEESDMFKLVRMVMERNFDPVSHLPEHNKGILFWGIMCSAAFLAQELSAHAF